MNNKINVSVIIGNPRAECARFGVCSIEGSDDDRFPQCPKQVAAAGTHRAVRAMLSIDHEQGLLQLEFLQDAMLPLTHQMFFEKGFFVMEVDKRIPDPLCKVLGLPNGTHFTAGKWPINQNGNSISVRIEADYRSDSAEQHPMPVVEQVRK